ncbi:hypothetical protein [Bartonella schoenbuchensis]
MRKWELERCGARAGGFGGGSGRMMCGGSLGREKRDVECECGMSVCCGF